ncbi:bifunctional riboflavin kinase/FAD synthetase [Clostridiales bacterium COT073_COT-073]|nr:bifunctional riboflavin kinase/FAD synthetase [Clostridiales bacterium COT073_COT-073]
MIIKDTTENLRLSEIVVILGNFDGIHRGHNLLVEKAKQIGLENGLKTAVLTFAPHPLKVFVGEEFRLIYTEEEKIALFAEIGLDYYILFPFTEEHRNMSPDSFIQDILLDKLGVRAVVVGSDYHFGKKAAGNAAMLKEVLMTKGITVEVMEKLQDHGQDISSTRLRSAIQTGNLKEFEELTGRHFHIRGKVRDGQKLGRTIGFPTANLIPDSDKMLPPNGVYLSEVIYQGQAYRGLSNIGISPSLENRPYSVETFILNFQEKIYGQEIEVRFLEYLRPEISFASLEELKAQITKDVELVKAK